jgi:hypothetical protein
MAYRVHMVVHTTAAWPEQNQNNTFYIFKINSAQSLTMESNMNFTLSPKPEHPKSY